MTVQRGHQLLTGSENRLRVAQHQPPGRRQFEPLMLPLEQLVPQARLQPPQLDAERRLGDPQVGRRPGQVTFVGHRSEVTQVMIVQERHFRTFTQ